MLPHSPECLFSKEDVQLIRAETGLDEAQILQWAWNFRNRYAPEKREAALRDLNPDQVVIVLICFCRSFA
jgi:hypothetical protein